MTNDDFTEKLGDQLEKATDGRISKEMVASAVKEAQLNLEQLENCLGPHDFVRIEDTNAPGHRQRDGFRCSKCGGMVTSVAARWYERGLRHGRGAASY